MSINHHSSDQIPEPHFYWAQYTMDSSSPSQNPAFFSRLMHQSADSRAAGSQLCRRQKQQPPAAEGGACARMLNLNGEEHEAESTPDDHRDHSRINSSRREEIPREHLFEKPLTPSDVGKLNRLVIPKQHAEKYFPLGGGDSGEKGFLLGFEDETGKSWRFRYSYWNSSQSYVLTKGWSRFVKEKRLDAGDFVLFSRHPTDAGRLFIGWRRRHSGAEGGGAQLGAGGGIFYNPYPNQQVLQGCSATTPSYPHETLNSGGASKSGNSRKLRLFGVNLECQANDSDTSTAPKDGRSPVLSQYHHQYYAVRDDHRDELVYYPAVFY